MADHRHKRDTNARRFPKAHLVAGPLAFLATASTVALGVVASNPETRDSLAASSSTSLIDIRTDPDERQVIARAGSRTEFVNLQKEFDATMSRTATLRAIRGADTKLWTTDALNLWTSPARDARKVGVLDAEKKVLVTGRKAGERVEVVIDGKARWVTAGYLTDEKPTEDVSESSDEGAGGSDDVDAACTNGSSVPSGVSPNVVAVHEAVCANFPELTSYGTFRSDGEHAQGLAIDIMVSGERGWQVAEFVRANYSELGVSYIIYSQNIWSVDRAGEGWRGMSDRGSTTANHFDHVHVTTY